MMGFYAVDACRAIVAELNPGGLIPMEPVKRSLHILTHRVMPAFK